MANAIYWFDPVAVGAASQLRPYAGGGLGAADFSFGQVGEWTAATSTATTSSPTN